MRAHILLPSRGALRDRGNDFHETPAVATVALMKAENLPHRIWEPAAGRGAITKILRDAGHQVISTDLVAYPNADLEIIHRIDFLMKRAPPAGVATIVSNFPYKLADDFIRHGLTLVETVIVLQPLRMIEGRKRADVIKNLHRVHVFQDRLPMMHRERSTGNRLEKSSQVFARFVFRNVERASGQPFATDIIVAEDGARTRQLIS